MISNFRSPGLSQGYDEFVVRGDENSEKFAVFYLKNGRLISTDAINSPAEFLVSKKLIISGVNVVSSELEDTSIPMKDILNQVCNLRRLKGMASITFIDFGGEKRTVEGKNGQSVMEAAVGNGVPGIDADCGGACACATCHVYVNEEFLGKLQPQDDMEISMLEFAENVKPNSRLACQIKVSDDLDGLTVTTPESQH